MELQNLCWVNIFINSMYILVGPEELEFDSPSRFTQRNMDEITDPIW